MAPSSPVEAAVRAAQNAQKVSGRCFAVKVPRPWDSLHNAGFGRFFSPGSPLQKLSILKSRICILNPANQSWFIYFSPHLCVGFLFLILYPGPPPRPPPPAPPPSHNLSHTTLSHTTCYPQLCQTQLVTHNLSPTTLSHTTCRPQLSHTQLVTHNFVTHNLSHNNLSPTTLSHTTCHPQLCTHNLSHTHTTCHPQLCHTHNSLSHTQLVTWQAWHLATATSPTTLSHTTCPPQLCHTQLVTHNLSPITLSHTQLFVTHNLSRGRRGTWRRPPSFCVAGVTLGNNLSPTTLPHTTCHTQLVTHNFVTHHLSRGRRGTWRHPPAFAGVALGDIYLRFTRQAWHLWHWAGSGGALGLGVVAGDAAALCVAGVALGDIYLRFTWRAWTWRHLPVFSVAGVALLALGWLWWRAWAGISRR